VLKRAKWRLSLRRAENFFAWISVAHLFSPTIHAQANREKSEIVVGGIHGADVSRQAFRPEGAGI
jgi:hypothetical protein